MHVFVIIRHLSVLTFCKNMVKGQFPWLCFYLKLCHFDRCWYWCSVCWTWIPWEKSLLHLLLCKAESSEGGQRHTGQSHHRVIVQKLKDILLFCASWRYHCPQAIEEAYVPVITLSWEGIQVICLESKFFNNAGWFSVFVSVLIMFLCLSYLKDWLSLRSAVSEERSW